MKNKKFSLIVLMILTVLSTGITVGCAEKNKPHLAKTSENDYRYIIEVDGKYGYINRKGEEVIKPQYGSAEDFADGLAKVCVGDYENCRYIDINGKVVNKQDKIIPNSSEFLGVGEFHEGLASVCKDITENQERCGYIDANKKIIIPLKYLRVNDFSDGLALVLENINEKTDVWDWYYINKKGKKIIDGGPYNDLITGCSENMCITSKGVYDNKGKLLFKSNIIIRSNFSDGLAKVGNYNEKCSYINKQGHLISPLKYEDSSSDFSEGLAMVTIGNKYGFIDKTGELVIPLKFDYYVNGRWGVTEEDILVPEEAFRHLDYNYRYYSKFKNGLARVSDNYNYGYIDKTGKYVWSRPCKRENAHEDDLD